MAIKQVSFDVTENKLRSYVCGTTDKLVAYPTDCDDGSTMVVLDNKGRAIRKLLFDGKSWKYVWHEITANDIVDTEVIPLVDGVCTIDVEYKATKKYHIDHIIPVSAYDFSIESDIKKCWNPRNLRIISAKENMIKKNNAVKLFAELTDIVIEIKNKILII